VCLRERGTIFVKRRPSPKHSVVESRHSYMQRPHLGACSLLTRLPILPVLRSQSTDSLALCTDNIGFSGLSTGLWSCKDFEPFGGNQNRDPPFTLSTHRQFFSYTLPCCICGYWDCIYPGPRISKVRVKGFCRRTTIL
jgi:hypothetical protein